MIWKQLKDFCNSLDEKQLNEKVILWREEEAINFIEAIKLEADHYISDGDDGCYTLSDAGLCVSDVEELGLEKVYEKGDPILIEEFDNDEDLSLSSN